MPDWILAGDVGGTKINLGLFEREGTGLRLAQESAFPSQQVAGMGEVVDEFMRGRTEKIGAVCFGVAGPIEDGRACMPNIRWTIDARELASRCGLPRVELINDLVATGYGINQLPSASILTLNTGTNHVGGNGALLAAGTGLGKAILERTPGGWKPLPSEGGHADFAPCNDEQAELMKFIRRERGGCDWERVLSGPGQVNIYRFFKQTNRLAAPPDFDALASGPDGARSISEAGLAGSPEIAVRALETFVEIYAAAAANYALECLATGGVWLGGGIAPKIAAALAQPRFMQAFLARDRLRDLIATIPVKVILDPKTALLGSAHLAAQML